MSSQRNEYAISIISSLRAMFNDKLEKNNIGVFKKLIGSINIFSSRLVVSF